MKLLADALERALMARLDTLADHIGTLRATLSRERAGLRNALELLSLYPPAAREAWGEDKASGLDDQGLVDVAQLRLLDCSRVSQLIEDWVSLGPASRVPFAPVASLQREADELLGDRQVVLAFGDPDNYAAFVADLGEVVFRNLQPPALPQHLADRKYALIQLPLLQGTQTLRRPALSHELAHLKAIEEGSLDELDLWSRFDKVTAAGLQPPAFGTLPPILAMFKIATNWVTELICDAYAIHRHGPAAVAGIGEVLAAVGATGLYSSTHPPAALRLELMVGWLGEIAYEGVSELVEPWRQLATMLPLESASWEFLVQTMRAEADNIKALVGAAWGEAYDWEARLPVVNHLSDRLASGIPETQAADGGDVADADVVLAAWLALPGAGDVPTERLADKAIESLEFLRLWDDNDGPGNAPVQPPGDVIEGSQLSRAAILARLQAVGDPHLVITPVFDEAIAGAAVDLRLGPRFIVFDKSDTPSFDPLSLKEDPRTMQSSVERAWGQPLVLHPGQLVLAATLEYLVLPSDLAGQVITRSSYGRLGLITATAVLVHPRFIGCLTLELVNLGEVPIELVPGERIAQLSLYQVGPPVDPPAEKYRYPTGPEFSKVRLDPDAEALRGMRRTAHQ